MACVPCEALTLVSTRLLNTTSLSMSCVSCRYPKDIEWPGDGLETELPASVVGGALTEYARPYTVSEARSEDSNEKVKT